MPEVDPLDIAEADAWWEALPDDRRVRVHSWLTKRRSRPPLPVDGEEGLFDETGQPRPEAMSVG